MKKKIYFIEGYIINDVERRVTSFLDTNESERMTVSTFVDKSWFGVSKDYSLSEKVLKVLYNRCNKTLSTLFNDYDVISTYESFKEDEKFTFTFTNKNIPKCMTLDEIEKELGYKITLIKR